MSSTVQIKRRTFLAAGLLLPIAGCGGGGGGSGSSANLAIAYQFGIPYAPLLIIKHEGWLQQDLKGTQVTWQQLSSGSDIRDGMLSGAIQVGSGGVAPFLIGYDAGVDWKLLTALEDNDLWMMAKDRKYQSLKDFQPRDKIALPSPGSIQAIIMQAAAKQQLGDAHALDKNIVALDHPQAQQAMLSGQVAAHFANPPFQYDEQTSGAHIVLQSYKVFNGPTTLDGVFVRTEYHDSHPQEMTVLFKDIKRAIELIKSDPAKAADILTAESGGKISSKDYQGYLTHDGLEFTTTPHAYTKFALFMKDVGAIKKTPNSWQDLVFDNLKGLGGS